MSSEPKERPILFSGQMVRAILDGRKTVTRRVMRTNHVGYSAFYRWDGEPHRRATMRCANETAPGTSVFCENNRFGVPDDRLWVRETWCYAHPDYHDEGEGRRKGDRPVREHPSPWWCHYAATDDVDEPKWRPSIYMPRWASRITLEIVDVRVERLHDITEEDARAEGVDWARPEPFGEKWDDDDREDPREVGYGSGSFALDNFRRLWSSISGAESWAANPWVWRIEFRRLS